MSAQIYMDNPESFERFQRSRQVYSPDEIPMVTDRCDDLMGYANIEAVFLYYNDAHIFQVKNGMRTQNGPFVSKCRYIIPGYPDEIIENDDLAQLEKVLFKFFLDKDYFDENQ